MANTVSVHYVKRHNKLVAKSFFLSAENCGSKKSGLEVDIKLKAKIVRLVIDFMHPCKMAQDHYLTLFEFKKFKTVTAKYQFKVVGKYFR